MSFLQFVFTFWSGFLVGMAFLKFGVPAILRKLNRAVSNGDAQKPEPIIDQV